MKYDNLSARNELIKEGYELLHELGDAGNELFELTHEIELLMQKNGVKSTVDPCSKLIRVKSRLDPLFLPIVVKSR